MVVAGPNGIHIMSFKSALAEDFDITDLGELRFMLGILITCDCKRRLIYLSQSAYIHQILSCFGMQDAMPVFTPLAVKHNLFTSQSPISKAEKRAYKDYSDGIHYLSLIGLLLFAIQTQPDIQFAVSLVTQFGDNPGIAHLEAAKCILCYPKGTVDFKLVLGRQENGGFDLVGWTDSNWGQDPDDRRSVGSFVFDIAEGCMSWSSKKQSTVATSSVEAEYVTSATTTKEAIWLRTLLEELNFTQITATIIKANNQGCIALAYNPVSHSRAKHIDIRHYFIREQIQ